MNLVKPTAEYQLYNGYAHLCAGLCCGLSSMVKIQELKKCYANT